ncbi:unnamed protein product, partial [Eruca vesicaria subsp. sativa]|nr:unnamed protein product [Eruca vesicaria subsp. sativa]
MIVMMMGNLLDQAKAQTNSLGQKEDKKIPFIQCYPPCLLVCKSMHKFPAFLICPFTCLKTCLFPTSRTDPSPSPIK